MMGMTRRRPSRSSASCSTRSTSGRRRTAASRSAGTGSSCCSPACVDPRGHRLPEVRRRLRPADRRAGADHPAQRAEAGVDAKPRESAGLTSWRRREPTCSHRVDPGDSPAQSTPTGAKEANSGHQGGAGAPHHYTFDRLVQINPHVIRLRPAPHSRTKIESYSLTVEPAGHFINWQQDPFGNFLARLVFPSGPPSCPSRSAWSPTWQVVNPFDFFIEDYAEHYGFELPEGAGRRPGAVPAAGRRGRPGSGPGPLVAPAGSDFTIEPRHPDRRLPGRAERCGAARRRLLGADGAGRADPGPHAEHRDRLLPGLGVAAGVGAARTRPGRPVRLRLPGAAGRRRGVAGRAVRPGAGLHRPARLDRGVHPGRRLDRPGPDVRACSPARGTSRCRRRRTRPAPPRSPGRPALPGHVGLRQRRAAGARGPAGDAAVHRRPVGRRSTRSGRRSTGSWPPATCG